MVMLFTGCAMADENNAKEDNVQYKVTPAKIKEVFEDGVIDVKTSSGTISQGETNWHSEYIGYYTKKLVTIQPISFPPGCFLYLRSILQ